MERVPRSILERRVFVDTSAFLAIVARNDSRHRDALEILDRLMANRYRLYTTRDVIIESHARILSTLGIDPAREFVSTMQPRRTTTTVLRPRGRDDRLARAILDRHLDKDYSFCDAISFAVMQQRGISRAFAFDLHFRQFGFSTPLGESNWP